MNRKDFSRFFYKVDTKNNGTVFFLKSDEGYVKLICNENGKKCFSPINQIEKHNFESFKIEIDEKFEQEERHRITDKILTGSKKLKSLKNILNEEKNFIRLIDAEKKKAPDDPQGVKKSKVEFESNNNNNNNNDNNNNNNNNNYFATFDDPTVVTVFQTEILNKGLISRDDFINLIISDKKTFESFKPLFMEMVWIKLEAFYFNKRYDPMFRIPSRNEEGNVEWWLFYTPYDVVNLEVNIEIPFIMDDFLKLKRISFGVPRNIPAIGKRVDFYKYNSDTYKKKVETVYVDLCSNPIYNWKVYGENMIFSIVFNQPINNLPDGVFRIELNEYYSHDITKFPSDLRIFELNRQKVPDNVEKSTISITKKIPKRLTKLVLDGEFEIDGNIELPETLSIIEYRPKNPLPEKLLEYERVPKNIKVIQGYTKMAPGFFEKYKFLPPSLESLSITIHENDIKEKVEKVLREKYTEILDFFIKKSGNKDFKLQVVVGTFLNELDYVLN